MEKGNLAERMEVKREVEKKVVEGYRGGGKNLTTIIERKT